MTPEPTTLSPFAGTKAGGMAMAAGAAMEPESQRAIAEVQAAIMLAKRFPRDQVDAMDRILQACCRSSLAESAVYSYTRGGQEVTGPSIRLAEALAQCWGNLQFGIRELAQGGGKSTVEAFAWDVETNTRQVKVFEVPHVRDTKAGRKLLTDARDVYEMVANQGARRLRSCILGVIPGDVVDAALAQCDATLATKVDVTPEGVRKLLGAFAGIGVTTDAISQKLGHKVESIVPAEFVRLRKVFASIRDGYTTADAEFPPTDGDKSTPRSASPTAAAAAAAAATAAARSGAKKKPPGGEHDQKELSLESMRLAVSHAGTVEDLDYLRKQADGHLVGDDLAEIRDLIHGKVELLLSEAGAAKGGAA